MSIHSGTSLDMTTSGDTEGTFQHSLDPGVQPGGSNLSGLLAEQYMQSGGRTQEYPNTIADINLSDDDINDLSFKDITDSVGQIGSQIGKSLYDAGKEVGKSIGLISEDKPSSQEKPKVEESKSEKPKQDPKLDSKSEKDIPEKAGSKQIEELQKYFANPTPALRAFIPGIKYTGPIDGIEGPQTSKVAYALEAALSDLLETNKVHGIVLRTNPQDIESALLRAAEFRSQKKDKVAHLVGLDAKMYKLSKLLIKNYKP